MVLAAKDQDLFRAAESGDEAIVTKLLASGQDPSPTDKVRERVLRTLVYTNNSLVRLRALRTGFPFRTAFARSLAIRR